MIHHHNAYSAIRQEKAEIDSLENLFNTPETEWVQVAPTKIVIATAQKTYLIDPHTDRCRALYDFFRDRPTKLNETSSNIETTRKLLDGAIAAARYAVKSDARPPELNATRWIWRLAGAYHLTHPVPLLLEEISERFTLSNRPLLGQWAIEKAIEEACHDLLALQDIRSLGYDAEAVVGMLVPPAAVALIDYLTRNARAEDPIDCVGYSYTMERLAMGVDEKYIQKVEALLPSNVKATRCLRVHSSVGADADHVEETVEMIAKLTSTERSRIARACYETALMCFSPPPEGYTSDAELQQIIEPLRTKSVRSGKE